MEIQTKTALDILNKEMSKEIKFDPAIPDIMQTSLTAGMHAIHNWLCEQINDEQLINAIVKYEDKKSIAGAIKYVGGKYANSAHKLADKVPGTFKMKDGGVGLMLPDTTVFSLVREYYISEKIEEKPKPIANTTPKTINTNKPVKKQAETISINLFDFA